VNAFVSADDAPFGVNNLAARGHLVFAPFCFEVSLDEARVVAVGHEADLLRLSLVGDVEAVPARRLARFVLRHLAQRKERARELPLRQLPQKV
jgi:hypothetical protein